MITTEIIGLCPHCFAPLSPKGVCTVCKKKANRPIPSPAHRLSPGSRLKQRYVLASAIGEGGFGITYLAFDTMNRARVAIKEYFPSAIVSRSGKDVVIKEVDFRSRFSTGKKRFMDEAKNMAAIKNLEGIPTALDYFSENGTAYIVMEYLDGITLKDYVCKRGRLKEQDAVAILRPVFASLAKVHDAGLIHRDVSADNIILTDGSAKLIDFGAAVSASVKRHIIELKRHYAPPEQYEKDTAIDKRADVYSSGATLYFCLTGALPPEATERLKLDKLLLPARLSPRMRDALAKALALSPADRYPDMRTFLYDIL